MGKQFKKLSNHRFAIVFFNSLLLPVIRCPEVILGYSRAFKSGGKNKGVTTTPWLMHASKSILNLYPPQVFTSVHLFNNIARSRFIISSPFFYNNWVKIHRCENKVWWRLIKQIVFSLSNKENNKTTTTTTTTTTKLKPPQKKQKKTKKRSFVQDLPCAIPKLIHLKIRRRDGVESLTNLMAGEFKVPIDSFMNKD